MKILLVDDSKLVFKMVEDMLGTESFDLSWVENGLEAVNKLSEDNNFDVILLDWNMPEMDGPTFLVKVKTESLTSTPIVMMTTEDKMDKMQFALENGAEEYITKPFTKDILLGKLEMMKTAI